MSTARKWYVVHTHPHAELTAAEHLQRQGFDIYMPRFRKKRSHARRVETVVRPLFPRYFFVAFDIATERWQAVRSTIGIAGLVGSVDGPTPVANSVLNELRGREDETGFFQFPACARFTPGERVTIVNGVLSTCIGLFEGMVDNDRIAVLLDLLGRQVRVIVDGQKVARA